MYDVAKSDDGFHGAHVHAEPVTEGRDGHQVRGHVFKDIAVIEGGGCFDAVIAFLVVDGFIEVGTSGIVGQFKPFQGVARAQPQGCDKFYNIPFFTNIVSTSKVSSFPLLYSSKSTLWYS